MKSVRSAVITILSLALLVTACSQPGNLQTELEPQFGGAGNDEGTALDVSSRGVVTLGADIGGSPQSQSKTLFIRQFDSSPKLLREIKVGAFSYDGGSLSTPYLIGTKTDQLGNVYAQLIYRAVGSGAGKIQLNKYAASGTKLLWKKEWTNVTDISTFDLDGNGNIFVSQTNYQGGGFYGLSYFTRYNPNGVKWYQRNSQVGPIRDLEVTANGDIYVIGEKGLSRYTNNGVLLWTNAVLGDEIAASGNTLFVLQSPPSLDEGEDITVSKLTSSGTVVWSKVVANYAGSGVFNLTADAKGNTYFNTSSPDVAPTTLTKLNSSGSQVWSKEFTIDASWGAGPSDLATFDGSSLYVAGSTDSAVNGQNQGFRDGYLIRLNSLGQQVWQR